MRELYIANRRIADDAPALVIAECSHNHLGNLELAREMVRLAAEAGADAVKFQKRGKSTYQGLRQIGEIAYADQRDNRELHRLQYRQLSDYAHELGLQFIVTVFDAESVDNLHWANVDAYKLASGDITNPPLLEYVARTGKPLLVSTGGADMQTVRYAAYRLRQVGAQFALLHCTSEYPVDVGNANLRVIDTLRQEFSDPVIGFSSHVHRGQGAGLEAAAYLLGARIFEKHYTITPEIASGEHAFGVTPADLGQLVSTLRSLPLALGDGVKRLLESEQAGVLRLGKHLAYKHDLAKGAVVCEEDLIVIGGGRGLSPLQLSWLIGGRLLRSVSEGEDVEVGDIIRRVECLA